MPRTNVVGRNLCALPVSVGMELLRNVTALYQNGFIGRSEKDFMTEQIENGLQTGDYTELHQFVQMRIPAASQDNPFYNKMKNLMEKEE